jgi:ATP-binding cassette subfamily G (WHITE) protein 2 (SNQ2)
MYYLSPFTYVIEGLLGQGESLHHVSLPERLADVLPALGNQLITCMSTELVTIEPPSGMSCSAYMDPYIAFAGGYLADPNATAPCAYCPFRTTDAYMLFKFNVSYGHHWRDLIIVLGVAGFNVRFRFRELWWA